jgi:beta-1,2-mannobiose phosphorylase / 1,2-beta-oligomannan phosphorylase
MIFRRSDENPIIVPNPEHPWEAAATFNGCPVRRGNRIHLLYRALSSPRVFHGHEMQVSSIGCASSEDGVHFNNRRQLISPQEEWERFGCEDPRVTFLNGKYYIFYTALSDYPFTADNIRVGLAISYDLENITARHPVTPFNAKAMALFPEPINGKMAAVLTANTDRPPARIGLAMLDNEEDLWRPSFWSQWYETLDTHSIALQCRPEDQVEVGAPPIKTKYGWLLIYSYIKNYRNPPATFTVEAALLDLADPTRVLARSVDPLLETREAYEQYGMVPNVVFPSGVLLRDNMLHLYYGAADTVCAVASCPLESLIGEMRDPGSSHPRLKRCTENPVLQAIPERDWEAKAVYNPGLVHEDGRFHLVYRAQAENNTSVLGYAESQDGQRFTRLPEPIYVPRADFEQKLTPGGNSGCEDPRLTRIGDRIYMLYTAYNGQDPPRVAITWIKQEDFINKEWKWAWPNVISPPSHMNKNAALFPDKIKGKYAILHRQDRNIWLDYLDNLEFTDARMLAGEVLLDYRQEGPLTEKVGTAAPPIRTDFGWLLIYHGVASNDHRYYYLKTALLDLEDPLKLIGRCHYPVLKPEKDYEIHGQVPDVVFSCGAAVVNGELFVAYGGADQVVGMASIELNLLLDHLLVFNQYCSLGF